MGRRTLHAKKATIRTIRDAGLSQEERRQLRENASYEGSPVHKRNPDDFGLTPPAAPRPDKNLCDEAGISRRAEAEALFASAVNRGVVSEAKAPNGMPKQIWAVDKDGRVFEAMYGGSRPGCYHGYPIRRADPFFAVVSAAWPLLPLIAPARGKNRRQPSRTDITCPAPPPHRRWQRLDPDTRRRGLGEH